MNKTMDQIQKEFDGQWIFMINCDRDEYGSILSGDVVLHSENRENVIRKMEAYDYEMSLTYVGYAGKIPEGVALL